MKYIVLVVGLLVVGCLTPEQKQKALRDSVVGEYEFKDEKDTRFRMRVLENGVLKSNIKDKQREEDFKWSISEDGELHVEAGDGIILVFRINKDGSITAVAGIDKDGRDDKPKEKQRTFKRIK